MRVIQKTIVICVVALMALAENGYATISGGEKISIDFTNDKDAKEKATWSTDSHVTPNGLGLLKSNATFDESWVRTNPIPVGISWRTPIDSFVNVKIDFTTDDSQKCLENIIRSPGRVFARYSWDYEHWSTWQDLPFNEDKSLELSSLYFEGHVGIPSIEYNKLSEMYYSLQKIDPIMADDENVLAHWVFENHPDFFQKVIPHVGYVEILYERRITKEKRNVKNLSLDIRYSVSGIRSERRNEPPSMEMGKWDFKLKDAQQVVQKQFVNKP